MSSGGCGDFGIRSVVLPEEVPRNDESLNSSIDSCGDVKGNEGGDEPWSHEEKPQLSTDDEYSGEENGDCPESEKAGHKDGDFGVLLSQDVDLADIQPLPPLTPIKRRRCPDSPVSYLIQKYEISDEKENDENQGAGDSVVPVSVEALPKESFKTPTKETQPPHFERLDWAPQRRRNLFSPIRPCQRLRFEIDDDDEPY